MSRGVACLIALITAMLLPAAGDAQSSIYGQRGLGHPNRALTPRARAIGGGLAAFEALSPVNPAAVAGFAQVTALAMATADFRRYEVDGVGVSGLRSTRFPLVVVGGRAPGLRVGYALSVAQYADRSFDLTVSDTVLLRGVPVAVTDRNQSTGGIADIRAAVAWAPTRRLRLGAGMHFLTGSAQLVLSRQFGDSAYRPFRRESDEQTSGLGVSAGVVWTPAPAVQFALAGRIDGTAEVEVDSVAAGTANLPGSLVGGVLLVPARAVRWATSFTWRSWSDADPDLVVRAFDTWEIGSGLEFGGPEGGTRIPIRLGVRYGTLPFAPTDDQPHELGITAGTGVAFAANRGLVDVALERILRDGAGASERAWQLSFSLTVRP